MEEEAKRLILDGQARPGLFTGRLRFQREQALTVLPRGLTVRALLVRECPGFRALPEDLWAGGVTIQNCPGFAYVPGSVKAGNLSLEGCSEDIVIGEGASIQSLYFTRLAGAVRFPARFTCEDLFWVGSPLESVPDGLVVTSTFDISESPYLRRLPSQMKVYALDLNGCPRLERLPDRLEACEVNVSGCVQLEWQDGAQIEIGYLNIADCRQNTSLPAWLSVEVSIDVANTGLTAVPQYHRNCRWRWHGVEVSETVAFRPDEISVDMVFQERNLEVRRVMLERMGWERFLGEARPQIRDRDKDSGGERRLLGVALPHEHVVILCMSRLSTGRRYFVRVPPEMATCHQAAAWMAGFEDPGQYEPVLES